ncbi:MAG: SGNH/GDSL hydrolase family protein, partial [Streptomyces sp.]|nr:SGNH/GDSL hydrolase family protein [Streptomyces sp.]
QVVRLTAGGTSVRVRLSNLYGAAPLRLTGATVARTARGAAVRRGSQHDLAFGGRAAASIPAGRERDSDPLPLTTRPLEKLTVTLYFARPTGPATYHSRALATSYVAAGDHRADAGARAFTRSAPTQSWYFLTRVDVRGAQAVPRDAVVALGDSLTDGLGSTVDADDRYPDLLADRLARRGTPRPVLDAGISGNQLLRDSPCGGGASALGRFRRDVAGQPGVRTVIVLVGVNDIRTQGATSGCARGEPALTAGQLVAGHLRLIAWAHERGLTAVGATLPPCGCGPAGEVLRERLNEWIRGTAGTRSGYDAVADVDAALADPAHPHALLPAYDSGDHLHPGDAGYRRMAAAVPLSAL